MISSTGVAGLTLGGGIGWLVGKHGMSIDNLSFSGDLVTADGECPSPPSVESHPDLFWALRGGGGNFGVATSLEFRASPAGRRARRIRRLPGRSKPAMCSRFTASSPRQAPEELTAYAEILPRSPNSADRLIAIVVCWPGPPRGG